MRRVPFVPTLIVGLAIALMIALGVWQIGRAHWKDGLIARYTAARTLPPTIFPIGRLDDATLFRRSSLVCLEPVAWSVAAGRSRGGASGWRHLAACRTGAEGPGATIDIGWSSGFDTKPVWRGGRVTGMISSSPDHRSLIAALTGHGAPPAPILVADVPAPGLQPSAFPDVAEIPNNHLAYAVQWFLFAGVAAIIYAIALWRRGQKPPPAPPVG